MGMAGITRLWRANGLEDLLKRLLTASWLVTCLLAAACSPMAASPLESTTTPVPAPQEAAATTTQPVQAVAASATVTEEAARVPSGTVTSAAATSDAVQSRPTPTFDPETWGSLPPVPEIGPRAVEILKEGLAKGNNPRAFSKIGDCESRAAWFLGDFDLGPDNYRLGNYETELSPVISYYAGSFNRTSLAARPGFTAASLLAPIWADKQVCQKDETPLACEYRVQRPLVAFILLGSNDASNPKTFEGHMRKVIEYTIAQGILPVLGTKADNVEGNQQINRTIARLSAEYGVPLWNFWAAVQGLPKRGLQDDGIHLTFGTPQFDDPAMMQNAWPVRNLNALQILERVMQHTQ